MRGNRARPLLLIVASLAAIGCEKPMPVEPFKVEQSRGQVDKTLPVEVQAKQSALIDLFGAIQAGTPFQFLPRVVPQVRFEESQPKFYENTPQLAGWSWDGPPRGEAFPVRLTMIEDKPGLPTVVKRRVYVVQSSGDRFVIRREKSKE